METKNFRPSELLGAQSGGAVPATNGESCSSFWRSGLEPFCNKNVAFSRSPRTTARKRGVSPFRVRHWAAPGGEAANPRQVLGSYGISRGRCVPSNLRRSSRGSFYPLAPQLRAAGSIRAHPLWKSSQAASPVCPEPLDHLKIRKIISHRRQ